jgi:hypothetical protein
LPRERLPWARDQSTDTQTPLSFGNPSGHAIIPPMDDPLAPRDDAFQTWVIGVAGALALAIYGIGCICTRSATLVGGPDGFPTSMPCHGPMAVGLGVMWIGVAALMHLHLFWSWRIRFEGYAEIGKAISLLVIIGGLFYCIYHFCAD